MRFCATGRICDLCDLLWKFSWYSLFDYLPGFKSMSVSSTSSSTARMGKDGVAFGSLPSAVTEIHSEENPREKLIRLMSTVSPRISP